MCRTPKGTKNAKFSLRNELIQIGAVLLDDNFEEIDTFMTYVSPQYSRITPVIQKLTGITQKDVSGAPKFTEALELFVDWIPSDAEIITWSENDACQINCEAEYKNVLVEHLHLDNCDEEFGYNGLDSRQDCYKRIDRARNAGYDIDSDVEEYFY